MPLHGTTTATGQDGLGAAARLQDGGGVDNPAFDSQFEMQPQTTHTQGGTTAATSGKGVEAAAVAADGEGARQQWSNATEFLMSCIAMSVGLGNVWRFPFTAYENGGGAFLIPYLVVLALIGKPLYYMEMALGQFASLGPVQVWELAPLFKGIGYGQLLSCSCLVTYYCSIMAVTVFYLAASTSLELPWAACSPTWLDCFDARPAGRTGGEPFATTANRSVGRHSSSELYFKHVVLAEVPDAVGIMDGIGVPGWALSLCLAATWLAMWGVTCCGVRSTGKASYFLALFPYVVMAMLLVRGVTLPGALDGILFFVRPDFGRLLDPTVWYAAVTQCFFSLGVGFGSLIMMSSYNAFSHDIYKDAMIVTSLDTLTSLLAGCTIFGILGNLALESGQDVGSVVQGGSGLAFVSYPEAIAKFEVAPQAFALLFFLMLLTLGLGSAVALLGNVTTLCRQALLPSAPTWAVSLVACVAGALLGLVYVTPGGQYVLTLVDYYAGTFPVFILVTAEMIVVSWVYGLDNLCRDVELMLGHQPGLYWRLTWGFITPVSMIVILLYTIATSERLKHNDVPYPDAAIAAGWTIAALGLLQIPLWAAVFLVKHRHLPFGEVWRLAVRPSPKWQPSSATAAKRWQDLRRQQLRAAAAAGPWAALRARIRDLAATTLGRHRLAV